MIDSSKSSQIHCLSLGSQSSVTQKKNTHQPTHHCNLSSKQANCDWPVIQKRCWEEALRGCGCLSLWVHQTKRRPPQPDSHNHPDHIQPLGSGHYPGCYDCSDNNKWDIYSLWSGDEGIHSSIWTEWHDKHCILKLTPFAAVHAFYFCVDNTIQCAKVSHNTRWITCMSHALLKSKPVQRNHNT